MDVTTDSTHAVKFVKDDTVQITFVSAYHSFSCEKEFYLQDAGNPIIDYLDNLEDVKYTGIYMYHTVVTVT